MVLPDERSRFESLTIDDEGFVILKWPAAVTITGPSARHAMDEVNRICGATRRPSGRPPVGVLDALIEQRAMACRSTRSRSIGR